MHQSKARTANVLIVDDDTDFEKVSEILKNHNYNSAYFSSGEEVLEHH